MKRSVFILLWLVAPMCLGVMATNLVVKPLSGADYCRELTTIGKVVYRGDSLYLYDSFGTVLYAEALGKVQQLSYSEGGAPSTSLPDTQSATATLRVYPNPTTSVLIMEVRSPGRTKGETEQSTQTARLYNQQGQLLKTTTLTTVRTTLDVSDLPAGTYLLLCEGGAFKVIKE